MDTDSYCPSMPTPQQEKAMEQLSPFEIKNKLINMAECDARHSTATLLNAGRGNPNWIATTPREAFFLLGRFALAECRRVYDNPVGVAGIPASDGIGARFADFLAANAAELGCKLLKDTFDYLVEKRGGVPDEIAMEWASGIMGDEYPTPDRILKYTEVIVGDYLALAMGDGAPEGGYRLFATEGSTAGMCYVFDSLQENCLLRSGDGIALMTPIFTPYLEIPELARFDFKVHHITADREMHDGFHTWQYPDDEIDKLRDPKIKLLCLVNPTNPPSYMLSQHTLDRLVDVVKNDNPGLMIVTDDVYGTFCDNFRSLMYVLPYNTMCLYSFSKYFGATGWRTAVIALPEKNIYDYLIQRLPPHEKAELKRRYASITPDTENFRFIDRMVADSRMVALNHTAGLSTPQQVQMSLFASFALLNHDNDGNTYQQLMQRIVQERLETLWASAGFKIQPDPLRAGYYSEIDIMVWARKYYSDAFAEYLDKTYNPLDFVLRLASETAVVLLNGDGFDGPAWSVRASLANLDKAAYAKIGAAIRRLLDEYYAEFQAKQNSSGK